MRKVLAFAAASAAFVLVPGPPATAAPPDREVDYVGDELGDDIEATLEDLFERVCGVDVGVEGSGRITFKTFLDRSGSIVREQVNYATRYVISNTETGATYTIRDVGPDRFLWEEGEPVILQMIGRSTTGSGVIGRVVLDISGDEPVLLSESGKQYGDFVENTCKAIT